MIVYTLEYGTLKICVYTYMNNHIYNVGAPQCTGERIRKRKKRKKTHEHMNTPQHHSPIHNSLNGLEIIYMYLYQSTISEYNYVHVYPYTYT